VNGTRADDDEQTSIAGMNDIGNLNSGGGDGVGRGVILFFKGHNVTTESPKAMLIRNAYH
jgi:hypothetical protein